MSSIEDNEKALVDDKGVAVLETVNAIEVTDLQYDEAMSRKIVAKFDRTILPMLFLMYLFNALDRGNLSNAKTDKMDVDLGFVGNQYSQVLSAFYSTFCGFCVPGALLTRRVGAKWTMPAMMLCWAVMCIGNAFVKDFAGVMGTRLALGLFEAGFAPSMIFYLTCFYTRGELGKRIAAFYCCLGLSGAFSGLLAYGVFQIKSHLKGWQILFLIEGCATVVMSAIAFFVLPKKPNDCYFLSEEEKHIASLRILKDSSSAIDAPFKYSEFFASLTDPKFWVFTLIGFSYGVGSGTASNFLPQIVGRLGFSTVKTNLYTVAPNMLSVVTLLITSWSSDKFRERSFHLMSAFVFTFTGCIILVAINVVKQGGVAYFAAFLIAAGAYTPSVIFHAFHNVNEVNDSSRAFRTGWLTFAANSAGLVSANIFRAQDAPAYIPALATTAAFEAFAFVLVLGLRTFMMLDNKKRNKAQGVNWTSKDVPTSALQDGPKNPSYRHFL